ncbi:MAG: hypothetical protein ABIA78_01825 [archaeon]
MFFNKKAQIWIETVIYTLIAIAMIGLVLSVVKPRIEEVQDKAIIEQSLDVLKNINSLISDIKRASGNQRIVELGINKGNLKIDAINDRIIFEIESKYEYSEPGQDIQESTTGINIHTEKIGKFNNVTLTKDYSSQYDLKYQGEEKIKSLTKASMPYKLLISNKGKEDILNKTIIDVELT